MTLHKLTGAGNCFLFIDLLRQPRRARDKNRFIPKRKRRLLARTLCDVYTGVGADGLIFLESSRRADVKWDFYNADGSNAEMCGNAARCVGAYLLQQYERVTPTTIITRSGIIEVRPLARVRLSVRQATEFQVTMPSIRKIEIGHEFDFIDSGVPHAVVHLDNGAHIKNVKYLEKVVEKIRKLRRFKKRGVNVTFYIPHRGKASKERSKRKIQALTFERGVRGFTRACGTGAVAAATSFAASNALTSEQIAVQMPGGRLTIELGKKRPILSGSAAYIAEIRLNR